MAFATGLLRGTSNTLAQQIASVNAERQSMAAERRFNRQLAAEESQFSRSLAQRAAEAESLDRYRTTSLSQQREQFLKTHGLDVKKHTAQVDQFSKELAEKQLARKQQKDLFILGQEGEDRRTGMRIDSAEKVASDRNRLTRDLHDEDITLRRSMHTDDLKLRQQIANEDALHNSEMRRLTEARDQSMDAYRKATTQMQRDRLQADIRMFQSQIEQELSMHEDMMGYRWGALAAQTQKGGSSSIQNLDPNVVQLSKNIASIFAKDYVGDARADWRPFGPAGNHPTLQERGKIMQGYGATAARSIMPQVGFVPGTQITQEQLSRGVQHMNHIFDNMFLDEKFGGKFREYILHGVPTSKDVGGFSEQDHIENMRRQFIDGFYMAMGLARQNRQKREIPGQMEHRRDTFMELMTSKDVVQRKRGQLINDFLSLTENMESGRKESMIDEFVNKQFSPWWYGPAESSWNRRMLKYEIREALGLENNDPKLTGMLERRGKR